VLVAVAVNNVVVVPSTVGLPEIVPLDNVKPVGRAFAEYVIGDPVAADALKFCEYNDASILIVALLDGIFQVTTSVLTVNVNVLVTVCNSASVAVIPNVYVVAPELTGAVPVITPDELNVEPGGKLPLAKE
jgi:hypothetical protein